MIYGASYDMHISFHGDHVKVENPDYEVCFEMPHECDAMELSELIKVAVHFLIISERTDDEVL